MTPHSDLELDHRVHGNMDFRRPLGLYKNQVLKPIELT